MEIEEISRELIKALEEKAVRGLPQLAFKALVIDPRGSYHKAKTEGRLEELTEFNVLLSLSYQAMLLHSKHYFRGDPENNSDIRTNEVLL